MAKMTGKYCEYIKAPKSKFDKRSFRWKQSGSAWVLVGCAKGEWQPRLARCKVGMSAHALLVPMKRAKRCKKGSRQVTKG